MTSGCAGDGRWSDALFVCIPVVYCVENVGFGVMHCLFICLSVYKWRLLTVQNLPFGSYTDNLEEFKVCVCVCGWWVTRSKMWLNCYFCTFRPHLP